MIFYTLARVCTAPLRNPSTLPPTPCLPSIPHCFIVTFHPIRYILFLDDDVAIYPHTIQTLVHTLSSDADLFMVTGWPYDVLPSTGMPVACLCRIVYRWFSMFPLTKSRVP